MIIDKIEINNFLCYAGNNVFEFSEGINVIIGDNGYGKSKLYDAFYWVMYDQVYVVERKEFKNTKNVKSNIISDKAKFDSEVGEIVCSVRITFHDITRGRDTIYVLERKYSIEKDSNDKFIEDNGSSFSIMMKELSYSNARLITDTEEENGIKEKILPIQMKDYLWFQGEQIENIIDFNQVDTLTKAINVLSNIYDYDKIVDIAKSVSQSASKEYDTEVRKLSRDKNESDRLEKLKLNIENEILHLQNDELEIRKNLSQAENKSESLLNKISDATKINELKNKKDHINEKLDLLKQSLSEEEYSFHKKMFTNKWILKGTSFLFENFSSFYSKYEENKLKEKIQLQNREDKENEVANKLQIRLPIDVPEPIYVQRMLDEEICLVCDREAKKNSLAWKKISELINQPKKKTKIKLSNIQDFSIDLRKLYHNGLSLNNQIDNIDEDIKETLSKNHKLAKDISNTELKLSEIENEIQNLLAASSLDLDSSIDIISTYSIQNQNVIKFSNDLNKITQQLEHATKNLNIVKENLNSLVKGEVPNWLIEKRDTLEEFELVAISTRNRVFDNLISELEMKANEHYEAMTKGNKSIRGKIKLRRLADGNYMPEITDEKGDLLLGSNTSNLTLVKLATIMAIVSSKGNSVNLYTLITDAPTSVFGEDYTLGFCKEISKVYKQSILLSKEFYKNDNLRKELLSNQDIKIGIVYKVEPSIKESERTNRNNLSTIIKQLN